MRALLTIGVIAIVIGASGGPAEAATSLGAAPPPRGIAGNCAAGVNNSSVVQQGAATGTYAVPAGGGVISQWSHLASGAANQVMRLRLFRDNGGGSFTAVAESANQAMTPNVLNTFNLRIPVTGGELIGLNNGASPNSSGACLYPSTGNPADVAYYSGDNVSPPLNTPATYTQLPSYLVNVSAVLEPDADRDGFGDNTQDRCLGTPGQFNGCPNTVTIKSAKQKGTKPKVKVTTTVPGAGTLKAGSPGDPALASAAAVTLKPVIQTITSTSRKQLTLTLKLTKSAKSKLARKGNLNTKVKVSYTPTGGPAGSTTTKVKLKS